MKKSLPSGKVGVLLNPGSGGLLKDGERLRQMAMSLPKGICHESTDVKEIESILKSFAEQEVDFLVVVAGDGTFHLVLSFVLRQKMFKRLPVFAVIPAGTTNMTAKDFCSPANPVTAMKALNNILQGGSEMNVTNKSVLRVRHGDTPDLFGMFYGAGLISDAVESFAQGGRGKGTLGEKASFSTFIRYLLRLFSFPSGEQAQLQVEIQVDNDTLISEPRLLIFASTLDRLLFGLKPYWGKQQSPIHTTILRQGPEKILLRFLPILFGHGRQLPNQGYYSENTKEIKMHFDGKFVIDGELYSSTKERGDVHVTADDDITVLKLS